MKCNGWQDKMSYWLDGELSPVEAEELRVHLADCGDCQASLDAMRRVDDVLRFAPTVSPQPGFTARFQKRLESRQQRRRSSWIGVVILVLVAGALSGLVLVLGLMSGLGLLQLVSTAEVGKYGLELLSVAASAAGSILNAMFIALKAIGHVLVHPVFVGYAVVTAFLFFVWTQVLRKRFRLQQSAS